MPTVKGALLTRKSAKQPGILPVPKRALEKSATHTSDCPESSPAYQRSKSLKDRLGAVFRPLGKTTHPGGAGKQSEEPTLKKSKIPFSSIKRSLPLQDIAKKDGLPTSHRRAPPEAVGNQGPVVVKKSQHVTSRPVKGGTETTTVTIIEREEWVSGASQGPRESSADTSRREEGEDASTFSDTDNLAKPLPRPKSSLHNVQHSIKPNVKSRVKRPPELPLRKNSPRPMLEEPHTSLSRNISDRSDLLSGNHQHKGDSGGDQLVHTKFRQSASRYGVSHDGTSRHHSPPQGESFGDELQQGTARRDHLIQNASSSVAKHQSNRLEFKSRDSAYPHDSENQGTKSNFSTVPNPLHRSDSEMRHKLSTLSPQNEVNSGPDAKTTNTDEFRNVEGPDTTAVNCNSEQETPQPSSGSPVKNTHEKRMGSRHLNPEPVSYSHETICSSKEYDRKNVRTFNSPKKQYVQNPRLCGPREEMCGFRSPANRPRENGLKIEKEKIYPGVMRFDDERDERSHGSTSVGTEQKLSRQSSPPTALCSPLHDEYYGEGRNFSVTWDSQQSKDLSPILSPCESNPRRKTRKSVAGHVERTCVALPPRNRSSKEKSPPTSPPLGKPFGCSNVNSSGAEKMKNRKYGPGKSASKCLDDEHRSLETASLLEGKWRQLEEEKDEIERSRKELKVDIQKAQHIAEKRKSTKMTNRQSSVAATSKFPSPSRSLTTLERIGCSFHLPPHNRGRCPICVRTTFDDCPLLP